MGCVLNKAYVSALRRLYYEVQRQAVQYALAHAVAADTIAVMSTAPLATVKLEKNAFSMGFECC